MKISEVIALFQGTLAQDGDLDVMVYNIEFDCHEPIEQKDIVVCKGSKTSNRNYTSSYHNGKVLSIGGC